VFENQFCLEYFGVSLPGEYKVLIVSTHGIPGDISVLSLEGVSSLEGVLISSPLDGYYLL
jgi:hypothetical protein